MTTTLQAPAIPGADLLATRSGSIIEQAKAVRITDKPSADRAAEIRTAAKLLLQQIDDTFDPLVKAAHEQHKNLLATKKKFSGPIELNVLNPINTQLREFEMQRERERRAEQARLQEIARKEAEERAMDEARLLAAQGETEAAEQVLEEAISAPVAPVQVAREKIEGVSFRSVWKWEITDITKLPLHLLGVTANASNGLKQEISTTGIGALVRTMKGQAEKMIPGVRVWEDRIAV